MHPSFREYPTELAFISGNGCKYLHILLHTQITFTWRPNQGIEPSFPRQYSQHCWKSHCSRNVTHNSNNEIPLHVYNVYKQLFIFYILYSFPKSKHPEGIKSTEFSKNPSSFLCIILKSWRYIHARFLADIIYCSFSAFSKSGQQLANCQISGVCHRNCNYQVHVNFLLLMGSSSCLIFFLVSLYSFFSIQ